MRAQVTRDLPGDVSEAERLWYDLGRWPSFIDGFARVVSLDGDWPSVGATLVWESRPAGRGRVQERVSAHEPGAGQTVEVDDERLQGTQSVSFTALDDGVAVSLELRYDLKQRNPFTPIVDWLFIRRALGDSLRRTLVRFGSELELDRARDAEPPANT